MSKGNRPFASITQDELEALDKDINQLKGLAALFVGLDLNEITPEELGGASWLLSDLVERMAQTFDHRVISGCLDVGGQSGHRRIVQTKGRLT